MRVFSDCMRRRSENRVADMVMAKLKTAKAAKTATKRKNKKEPWAVNVRARRVTPTRWRTGTVTGNGAIEDGMLGW